MADLTLGVGHEMGSPAPSGARAPRGRRMAYGLAIAVSLAAFTLHLLVGSFFSDVQADLVFLVPAILISGALGGLGPGVLATVLCLTLNLFVTGRPLHHPPNSELVTAGVFLAMGIGMAFFGERLRRMRLQAESTTRDLLARETHLQSVLATIPDAMIIADEDGAIRSFSPAAERMFGYTAAEAVGHKIKILMPAQYGEMHDDYMVRYLQSGQRRIIGRVAVGARKDGSTFPIEIAVGELDSNGRRMFTAFIRDISERQETEARLQELQAELVHISRLTAMGEMASALAHELNQPLSAISNYMTGSRRLLAGKSDEQSVMVREAVDRAVEQALRAGQIIRRLRDFVAHRESERRVENLRKLVEEASALALVGAKELGVRFLVRLDPSILFVLVDKVQIQQVLLNLVRNAIEAMEDSERRELTLSSTPAQDDMVILDVADTGTGVSPEIADQLFQPFVTTKAHGMGIGLSISRTIIEAQGGRIWVEPNPGGGTVFRMTLPVVVEEELVDGS